MALHSILAFAVRRSKGAGVPSEDRKPAATADGTSVDECVAVDDDVEMLEPDTDAGATGASSGSAQKHTPVRSLVMIPHRGWPPGSQSVSSWACWCLSVAKKTGITFNACLRRKASQVLDGAPGGGP